MLRSSSTIRIFSAIVLHRSRVAGRGPTQSALRGRRESERLTGRWPALGAMVIAAPVAKALDVAVALCGRARADARVAVDLEGPGGRDEVAQALPGVEDE